MLKQQAKLFNRVAAVTDLVTVIVAFVMAYHARKLAGGLSELRDYLWILLFVIPTWYFLLAHFGLYASMRTRPLGQILASLMKVTVIGGIVISSIIYFTEPHGFSRGLIGSFLVFSFFLLTLDKITLKLCLAYIRRQGYNTRNILIVGTDDKSCSFCELIGQHGDWGLKIVGVLEINDESGIVELNGSNLLGQLDDLVEVCKENTVDEVVFCVSKETLPDMEDYLRELEEMGITVRMVLDFYDAPRSRTELSLFHDEVPMLTFYCKAFDADQLFLKRCLDIIGAVVGLLATAALFPFIAIAIKINSKGPLFFGQQRVGESGRTFKCWKFRSMYLDAEARKNELMHLNEMNGAIFKIKDDPRITRVGKFIRKTSLDELPQFWNVLRGEMSLVGTRPPTPDEVANYQNWHRKRICIKPGITGLWQVSGRNQIQDFDEVVRLDLEYIDRWTLWLDIKILLKTFWVVFARSGSC